MDTTKTTWYSVTIWHGQGNGETLVNTTSITEAMIHRRHTTILEETIYSLSDLYLNHLPRTTIDVYRVGIGENIKELEPVLTLTWY